MIIPLNDVLDAAAKKHGYANWYAAVQLCDQENLQKIYESASIELSTRAFNDGWNKRSKLVSYSRKDIDKRKETERSFIPISLGLK